jgi:hypothetical protein
MTGTAPAAALEAARIAQVGYTAVIDRMTPALDLSTVAANVGRSVGSAGGAPADAATITQAWAPVWQRGAVSLFEERLAEGEFGTSGTFAFGITVAADGAVGALVATAVLHEPSAQLRTDADTTSTALAAVIRSIRPGLAFDELAALLAEQTAGAGVAVELVALMLDGAAATAPVPGDVVADGAVLAIGAITRTVEGPIVFQTTVHVSAEGAERLEAFPLRLIELR